MANASAPTLQFLGAAGGVTGSKYLFSNGTDQVLIDCGLFQGLKELRLRNWLWGFKFDRHNDSL